MSMAVAPEAQIGDVIQWPKGKKLECLAEVRAINTDQGVRKLVTTQGTIAADTEGLVIVQRRGESPAALAPADDASSSPLTPREEYDLKRCEAVIESGLRTFYQVGSALSTIRERRLYRATHATFDAYCRERWQMTKTSANRNIAAAEIADRLAPMGVTPEDVSERQIRPLAKLPEEQQPEAWQRAEELAGGAAVTSAHVEQAVIEFAEPKRPDYRGFDVFQRVKWVELHPQGRGKEPLEITRYGKVDALYNGSLIVKLPEGGIVSLMPDREEGIWRTEAVGVCEKCHAETEQFYTAPLGLRMPERLCPPCGEATERAMELARQAEVDRATAEAEMRAEQCRLRNARLERLFARALERLSTIGEREVQVIGPREAALLVFDSLWARQHPQAIEAADVPIPDFLQGTDFATEHDALEELSEQPLANLLHLAVLNALAENEERLEWYVGAEPEAPAAPPALTIVDGGTEAAAATIAESEAVREPQRDNHAALKALFPPGTIVIEDFSGIMVTKEIQGDTLVEYPYRGPDVPPKDRAGWINGIHARDGYAVHGSEDGWASTLWPITPEEAAEIWHESFPDGQYSHSRYQEVFRRRIHEKALARGIGYERFPAIGGGWCGVPRGAAATDGDGEVRQTLNTPVESEHPFLSSHVAKRRKANGKCVWCGGFDNPDGDPCPQSVDCPLCGAKAGSPCKRPSGHQAMEPHAPRVEASRQ